VEDTEYACNVRQVLTGRGADCLWEDIQKKTMELTSKKRKDRPVAGEKLKTA
jgi:hypothetical protein